jgi:hypothetical protein
MWRLILKYSGNAKMGRQEARNLSAASAADIITRIIERVGPAASFDKRDAFKFQFPARTVLPILVISDFETASIIPVC